MNCEPNLCAYRVDDMCNLAQSKCRDPGFRDRRVLEPLGLGAEGRGLKRSRLSFC